jgi:hypothetical protein
MQRRQCLRRMALGLGGMVAWSAWPEPLLAQNLPLPVEIQRLWNAPRLQGQATLRFMGMNIYHARLWVGENFRAQAWQEYSLALELQYLRGLSGSRIAQRSLQEMQRNTRMSEDRKNRWAQAMNRLFPDVKAGDRITGCYTESGLEPARFFLNGQLLGTLEPPTQPDPAGAAAGAAGGGATEGAPESASGAEAALKDRQALAQSFFGIWLAPQTSEPGMREKLLNGGSA